MSARTAKPLFEEVAFIGMGLIGSSLARAMRREAGRGAPLAGRIVMTARSAETRARVLELGIADRAFDSAAETVKSADLVILCSPIGTFAAIADEIGPRLAPGAIVSDIGSTKTSVIRDVGPHLGDGVHFVPAHPIAGTEMSGPDAGFAELFEGRWCIVTPPPGTDAESVEKIKTLWRRTGARIETMDAEHHDQVLAITSHLPHLIAYTIVGTAVDLETSLRQEVVKFSASGFRDFTRIAASDPVMWRDIFLGNRDAVLEMLGRFSEDLSALQRAIRWGEGEKLEELFTRTRKIRREIIEAKQA